MKLVLLLVVVVYLTHVTCDDPSCFYVCCNPSCSVKCRLCYDQGRNGVNQKRQSPHKRGLYYPLHREKNIPVNPRA